MGERAELLSAILEVSNYLPPAELDVRRVQNAAYLVYLAPAMDEDTMSLIDVIRDQFDRHNRQSTEGQVEYINNIMRLIHAIMSGWVK